MNPASTKITTAVELHEYLTSKKNFDFKPDGRDLALYNAIKRTLNLPSGEFKPALRKGNLSAEVYLRALMDAAEPLARMYNDILNYCKNAGFLRSKGGAQVAWELKSDCQQISFSFEEFRLFEDIRTLIEPSVDAMGKAKNEIMDWLAHDVFAPNHSRLTQNNFNWSEVDLFRILAEAKQRYKPQYPHLFGGLERRYLNGTDEALPTQQKALVEKHPDYFKKLATVKQAFVPEEISSIASKFINLPFWKFRWQVYEIWNIALALSEFEKLGFELVKSSEGASLVELGREAILAIHSTAQVYFIYQPRYLISSGDEIHPDIVIANTQKATPENVHLIIECKQRRKLDVSHLEQVSRRYESGLNEVNGKLLIVNYDDAPPVKLPDDTRTTLLGNLHPQSKAETTVRRFLQASYVATICRRETWFVDVSMSMAYVLNNDLRNRLITRSQTFESCMFKVYGFAQEIKLMTPSELFGTVQMSSCQADANWQLAVLKSLYDKALESLQEGHRVFIVSDLATEIKELLCQHNNRSSRLVIIDPTRDSWLDALPAAL